MILPSAAISRSDLPSAARTRLERTEGLSRIAFKAGIRDGVGGTRLDRLYQSGAAKIRLPHVAAGAPPQAVLINTAGGLTGGDRMAAEVSVADACRAVITTQACEKIYRADAGEAEISTSLAVGEGARLDWLPQETILFDGARLKRRLDVSLAPGAELLAVESVIFGRRAHGESVRAGFFADRWRIRRSDRLVFADDLRFDWTDPGLLARPAVLAGAGAMATLLLVADEPEQFLDAMLGVVGGCGGVSAWNGKLLARIAAADGVALRRILIPAIGILREGAALPNIWRI